MKWVKRTALAVVVVVAAAFGALLAASQREEAGHNHASVVVDRGALDVYRYFTDYEQVKRWVPMIHDVKYVKGTKLEPGSIARLQMEGAAEDEEIVAMEPGRDLRMKLTGTQGEFDEDCDYRFVEENGKTTVTVDAHTTYHGVFALLEPLITPSADKALADALSKLKTLVENEVPAH